MQNDPAGVVRAYWQRVWNEGDLDALDDLLTDPYTRHSANGNIIRDRKHVRQDMVRYRRSLYKADATIDDQAVSGSTVWTRVTLRAVNVDTEEAVVYSWLHVARVVDGRIAEAWNLNAPVDWASPPHTD
jgi:predicted SnoaL-like aldol condensation-catalyzing enzyme